MNATRCGQRGFTLLELLVAVGVFAVMAVMAYGGLKSVLDSRKQTDAQARRLAAVQLTFTRLERDIEQMTNRRIRDEFGDPKGPLLATSGREVMVEFTHGGWSNPANELRSTLQRVAYTVKDNKLYRAYWLVLDRAQDSVPIQTVLLDPVKSMEWRFMDNAGNWSTDWPPVTTSSAPLAPGIPPAISPLPKAVEVTLELEDLGRLTRLFMVATERSPAAPAPGLPPPVPTPTQPPVAGGG